MKDEKLALGLFGAAVIGTVALIFRQLNSRLSASAPLNDVDQRISKAHQRLDEMLDGAAELLRECDETTALAESVLDPNPKVVALPPWRFRRLAGIPAPLVVDARRLEKLPAADIRHALHRAYAGNLQPAKRLHAQLRLRAERAVTPLRESAVGALEDMYVLHPNADFVGDVIDV